jgi:hypothetical protein
MTKSTKKSAAAAAKLNNLVKHGTDAQVAALLAGRLRMAKAVKGAKVARAAVVVKAAKAAPVKAVKAAPVKATKAPKAPRLAPCATCGRTNSHGGDCRNTAACAARVKATRAAKKLKSAA